MTLGLAFWLENSQFPNCQPFNYVSFGFKDICEVFVGLPSYLTFKCSQLIFCIHLYRNPRGCNGEHCPIGKNHPLGSMISSKVLMPPSLSILYFLVLLPMFLFFWWTLWIIEKGIHFFSYQFARCKGVMNFLRKL